MGFGNILYLALWAWRGRQEGLDTWFLATPKVTPWLLTYPRLAELAIRPEHVSFRDGRVTALGSYGRFGEDFTRSELHEFVVEFLPTAAVGWRDDTVVINVRRGDYYSVPANRGALGFDVSEYLRVAVSTMIRTQGPVGRLHVVSDGQDWCHAKLPWLADHCEELTFAPSTDASAQNFREVATSPRVILTNSTFSYWAGYVHDVTHPGRESAVWAPSFFARGHNGGQAWQLDPAWSIVQDIPGGWDS